MIKLMSLTNSRGGQKSYKIRLKPKIESILEQNSRVFFCVLKGGFMKKAFTLVELLAVIILLGLLGLIIYPTVNGVINNNKQKLHDKQINELIRHAETYAASNSSKLRMINGSKNIVTIDDLYEK